MWHWRKTTGFWYCWGHFCQYLSPLWYRCILKEQQREILAEIIPQILVNRQPSGCAGGDFNCIINKLDATNNPEQKLSPCLNRLTKVFDWCDSYRYLHPTSPTFSRYYEARGITGASRIDRQYHWGSIVPTQAEYTPIAFSDHFSYTVKVTVPDQLARMSSPRSRPLFKIKEEVANKNSVPGHQEVGHQEMGASEVSWVACPLLVGVDYQTRNQENRHVQK